MILVGRLGAGLAASVGIGDTLSLGTAWLGPTVTSPDSVTLVLEPASQTNFEALQIAVTFGSTTAKIVSRPNPLSHKKGVIWECNPVTAGSLAGDSDVDINSPQNADVLTYVTADGKWENKPIPATPSGGYTARAITTSGTLSDRDFALCDASGGDISRSLPAPSDGATIIVKNVGATGTVTVTGTSTELPVVISVQNQSFTFNSSSVSWWVV